MLAIGESFSSAESATLRDALARQSGKFFEAFHTGNMQVCRPNPPPPPSLFLARSHMIRTLCWLRFCLHAAACRCGPLTVRLRAVTHAGGLDSTVICTCRTSGLLRPRTTAKHCKFGCSLASGTWSRRLIQATRLMDPAAACGSDLAACSICLSTASGSERFMNVPEACVESLLLLGRDAQSLGMLCCCLLQGQVRSGLQARASPFEVIQLLGQAISYGRDVAAWSCNALGASILGRRFGRI